jgi:hypothetical protein
VDTITITVSLQTINTIGQALQEMPFKLAHPAIAEIEPQVQKFREERNKKALAPEISKVE